MSDLQDIKTNYLCQCTVSLTNENLFKQITETKKDYNNVSSIHEIDEEDDDEYDIVNYNNLNDNEEEEEEEEKKEKEKDHETVKDKVKDSLDDDESAYTNESFYSDDTCDESDEETASQYLISGSCSLYINDNKSKDNDKLKNLNDQNEIDINYNEDIKGSINLERNKSIRQNSDKYLEFGRRLRRKNMSFTDNEVRKIEHENEILLRKIMAQHQTRDKIYKKNDLPKISSSAINRKKLQKKIEGDNMVLLRRIQQAKPCVIPKSTTPGYRMTFI